MGDPGHDPDPLLGPCGRGLDGPGVALVDDGQGREQHERHQDEPRMDQQEADQRHDDQCHDRHGERQRHQHRRGGLDVGVGVGEEAPRRPRPVERQRGVEVPVEDGEPPRPLRPGDGGEVEEPTHHHRHATHHADQGDRDGTGQGRATVDAAAVEAGDDQLVGDPTQDDRVPDDGHGEHIGSRDAEQVRQGVGAEGPDDEPAPAPEDPVRLRWRRGRVVRGGQRSPGRTPSTSPRSPRP